MTKQSSSPGVRNAEYLRRYEPVVDGMVAPVTPAVWHALSDAGA
ncbi:hypothetical protein ACFW9I_29020 [[Kitasatospora] papulosa]